MGKKGMLKNKIEKNKVISEQGEENYQGTEKEDKHRRKMRQKLYGGRNVTFLRQCFENVSYIVKSFLTNFQNKELHIPIHLYKTSFMLCT